MGQMAIAIALPGLNNLGRSVAPLSLLMDHFLYRFSTFREKTEKNLSIRNLTKMHHRTPFLLILRVSVRRFQMHLEGSKFCENVGNTWNYLRNRPTSTISAQNRLSPLTHPQFF